MKPKSDTNPNIRRLVLAFAVVGFAFIASSMYAQYSALGIDREVSSVVANGLVSMEKLAAARTSLRHLEVSADAFAEGDESARPAMRVAMGRARRQLNVDLMAHLAADEFPGERELYAEVPPFLEKLDDALDRLGAAVATKDFAAARKIADGDVRDTVEFLDSKVLALEEANGTFASESAGNIRAIRARSMTIAFVLDGVCIVLAAAAAFFVARAVRRYTKLAEAHRELQANRADELEQFAKRVAHDLLSPLSALSFCLTFLKRHIPPEPQVSDAFARANKCVKRSQNMVHAIFQFARSGARPAPGAQASVQDALDDVIEELGVRETDAKIDVAPFPPCETACEPGVLVSIVGNLVGNAVKYLKESIIREVHIRVEASASTVRMEIEDTGPGIPPGLEAAIFEPYVRAPGVTAPGLGLGLATVSRLVQAHGGTVGVRTSELGGCIFWFELPRARPAAIIGAHEARDLAVH